MEVRALLRWLSTLPDQIVGVPDEELLQHLGDEERRAALLAPAQANLAPFKLRFTQLGEQLQDKLEEEGMTAAERLHLERQRGLDAQLRRSAAGAFLPPEEPPAPPEIPWLGEEPPEPSEPSPRRTRCGIAHPEIDNLYCSQSHPHLGDHHGTVVTNSGKHIPHSWRS